MNKPKRKEKPKSISEPKVFPRGLKIFEIEFDYKNDIGVPGVRPIDIRMPREFGDLELATVQLERLKSSLIIDSARSSSDKVSARAQTTSVKRIPKGTPTLKVSLSGTEPLYYRMHHYTRIVAPCYRTKVVVRLFSNTTRQGDLVKKAMKYFNQFLKAYRSASGDPVPLLDEDEDKELRIINFKYSMQEFLTVEQRNDMEKMINLLHSVKCTEVGPAQMGFKTNDFDMAPKPYIKPHVLETIRLSLIPEDISPENELIIEAIERAYRHHDYGMGIVMLNTAFEAAIMANIIGALIFLDYDEASITQFFNEHSELEDKRKTIDDLREQACNK